MTFVTKYPGTAKLEYGADFGLGSAFYFNGKLVSIDRSDIWWGMSWGSGDMLKFNLEFEAGEQKFQAWGMEGCCDGKHQARITYKYRKPITTEKKLFTKVETRYQPSCNTYRGRMINKSASEWQKQMKLAWDTSKAHSRYGVRENV